MGEIRPQKCEGRELTKDQLAGMDVPSCGTVSAGLAFSYNSRNWSAFGQTPECTSRWAKHGVAELFPNVPGRRDSMQTYPNTLLEVDGRLLVHASAATHVHGFVAPGASSMVTYELRLDGFVYLSSNASDGGNASLTTKVISWRGGDLLINADAKRSAGSSVSVGVLDKSGAVIPGYGPADAPAFTGNSSAFAWAWAGGRKMAALKGRAVAISVTLTGGARLYSIRGDFSADASGSASLKSDDSPADINRASPARPSDDSTTGVALLPARIVVADDASETEVWAAGKLAGFLKLPIMGNGGRADGAAAQIAVGHGAATALGVPAAALAPLDDDSYLVSTTAHGVPPGSVAIASSARSARGTMYGAFAFLRALGFEFFAEDATRIPNPLPAELPAMDTIYSPSYESRDLTMASRGIGSNLDRIHTDNPPFFVGNCTAMAKAKHWSGGRCQRHGTIWRPGRNLSAALGLNGAWAFGPVGGFLAASDPPGGVATAFNLLTPSLNADVPDCAGIGTYEPHAKNTPCPAVFRQHPEWFTCGGPEVRSVSRAAQTLICSPPQLSSDRLLAHCAVFSTTGSQRRRAPQ